MYAFNIKLDGMNLIEDAFLQPRVLEHRAILGGDLVLIDDALKVVATGGERRGGNLRIECGTDRGRARLSRRVLSLFLAALAAPTPAPSAPTPAAFFRLLRLCARRSLGKRQGRLGFLHFRERLRLLHHRFDFLIQDSGFGLVQRFEPLLRGLYVLLALDARLLDALVRGPLGSGRIRLLGFIENDALALLFLVDECRLHAGQDAHHAPLVDIADDALILFATLDVKLRDPFVFDNRDLFFASIDADDQFFCHVLKNFPLSGDGQNVWLPTSVPAATTTARSPKAGARVVVVWAACSSRFVPVVV